MHLRYKKMLAGMKDDGASDWYVYILRCCDGTLYTGITKDLKARLRTHNLGRGGAYTKTHRPVTLLYSEPGYSRAGALRREAAIKRLPRPRKEILCQA
jgi:putative endonuclease